MAEVTRTTTVTVTTSPAGVVTTTTVTEAFAEPQASVPTSTKTDTSTDVGTVDVAAIGSGAAPAAGSKKQSKKAAKKEAKKAAKKEAAKEEPAAAGDGPDPKLVKKAFKEGGKKGQDLSGMADMGGISFFHVALESCDGDFALVEEAMKGANQVVAPDSEERKGGAGHLGKMFLSASVKQLVIMVHVPETVRDKMTLDEWVEAVNAEVKGQVLEKSEEYAKIIAPLDESKERFPLKMRDAGINAGFALLRSKKLVMDDDDSDDDVDYSALQDAAGIEW